jgi:hypothetical protein
MTEWTDGSLIDMDVLKSLSVEQLQRLTEMLAEVK